MVIMAFADNSLSQTSQRFLGINNKRVGRSIERVSFETGVKRSDDATGLAISELFRSGIRTLRQGELNSNEGVSLINIKERLLPLKK